MSSFSSDVSVFESFHKDSDEARAALNSSSVVMLTDCWGVQAQSLCLDLTSLQDFDQAAGEQLALHCKRCAESGVTASPHARLGVSLSRVLLPLLLLQVDRVAVCFVFC